MAKRILIGTQNLLQPPTLLDGKTHHWFQLWKGFRLLANRGCKTNEPCAKWSVATTGPFQHVFLAYYCSLEGDMLSPPLSMSHNCQGLSLSRDPSRYKTEYYWEGSPNLVTILKASLSLQGFPKIKKGEEKNGGKGNQAVSNALGKYGGSGWKIWLSCRTGASWAATWRDN